jgi:hypothetical protein
METKDKSNREGKDWKGFWEVLSETSNRTAQSSGSRKTKRAEGLV